MQSQGLTIVDTGSQLYLSFPGNIFLGPCTLSALQQNPGAHSTLVAHVVSHWHSFDVKSHLGKILFGVVEVNGQNVLCVPSVPKQPLNVPSVFPIHSTHLLLEQ